MVVHPPATLCAVNQTCQRIRHVQRICPLYAFQRALGKLPCFFRYNGFMGILEDQQLFRRVGASLIFVIPFSGTKIDRNLIEKAMDKPITDRDAESTRTQFGESLM